MRYLDVVAEQSQSHRARLTGPPPYNTLVWMHRYAGGTAADATTCCRHNPGTMKRGTVETADELASFSG